MAKLLTSLTHGIDFLKQTLHGPTRAILKTDVLMKKESPQQAAAVVDAAMKKYGHRSDLLMSYGKVHSRLGNNEKVIAALNEIPVSDETDSVILFDAASMLTLAGDEDSAFKIFDYLMKQRDHCHAALWIAQGSTRLKSFDAAVEAYSRVFLLGGRAPWDMVIRSIEQCSDATAKKTAMELTDAEFGRRTSQYCFKMLSLLEAKLGRKDASAQAIRQATEASFTNRRNPIAFDHDCDPIKPKFLIIGAMKCGTTTLFKLLTQHPLCLDPMEKEMQFFQFPHLDDSWYLNHYPQIENSQGYFTGDASPGYYIFNVHHRIKQLLPDVKILFIQRDPVARAISHVRHNHRQGISAHDVRSVVARIDLLEQSLVDDPSNAEKLMVEMVANKEPYNAFLILGLYDLYLRRWQRLFGERQLLTLTLEELTQSPQLVMDRVFNFLEVPSAKVELEQVNKGSYSTKDPETQEAMDRLRRFYDVVSKQTKEK